MPRVPTAAVLALLAAPAACLPASAVRAQRGLPADPNAVPVQAGTELERIGVDERLDTTMPLDLPLRDHSGAPTTLRALLDGERPVVFTFAYHSCPVLCSMVLEGLVAGLRDVDWEVGREFDLVNVSIDPRDTPEAAAARRDTLRAAYARGGERGWHFLTAEPAVIASLTRAAGFRYFYDARQENYAHPAVVMMLTPDGTLARYLYGLRFDPNDLRVGLLEASAGRSVSTLEKVVLYCYRYDPQQGKYVIMATRVMQIGGALTALVLGGALAFFWRRELRRRRPEDGAATA